MTAAQAKADFSWGGIFLRIFCAVVLVLTTFNPSGWSYHHWFVKDFFTLTPAKALVGALLIGCWVLYARAAYHALGRLGVAIAVLVFGAFIWLLADWGWLDPKQPKVFAWVALVVLGLVMGIGLAWSIVRRRLTGQVDVEEASH